MAETKSTQSVKEESFAEKLGHSVGTAVGAIKEKIDELVHPSPESESKKAKPTPKRKTVPAKKAAVNKKVPSKKPASGVKSKPIEKKNNAAKPLATKKTAIPKKVMKHARQKNSAS